MSSNNVLPEGYVLEGGKMTYRIERVLGRGGFGITYLASAQVRVGNVSIKGLFALKEHFVSEVCERDSATSHVVYSNPVRERVESSRKDFVAEAKRLQKVGVDHPNIVKVNEVFEANNTAYYVMEYLDGESLRKYVYGKQRLTEDETWRLMAPIVEAVKWLHANRMTHLDIKPDNIMLAHGEDGSLRPVLIDFGLSKHYNKDGSPTSTINTLGCSDGYAPIEQYVGITTFSPTADYYALGATMWFCLTGKDPARSSDTNADRLAEELPADVGDATRAVLRGALQTDRTQRTLPQPVDVAETIRKNEAATGQGKPTKQPERKPTRDIDRPKKSRLPLALVCTGAVILAAIIVYLFVAKPAPGRTTPRNLDLCATIDGEAYYFDYGEWSVLTSEEKAKFDKEGIVVIGFGEEFVLSLDCSDEMTWEEAAARYGERRLPSEVQLDAISRHYHDVELAIVYFGGTAPGESDNYFWGKSESETMASCIDLDDGEVSSVVKNDTGIRVRTVSPLP